KQSPPKYPREESLKRQAVWSEMEVTSPDATSPATFTFLRGHAHIAMAGDIPRERETYVIDRANNTVLRHTRTQLEPAELMGGSIKMITWDTSTDFIVIDPTLPPFIAKTKSHSRIESFGKDTGDVESESLFTDYQRVKCYDDRFEVKVGEPSMTDFLPAAR
ncbi:MAG: hypothetical protein ABIZ49_00990, partial [Opitutaceae bacterium]